jgi:hypothetical protein
MRWPAVALLLLLPAASARAQDSQYWTLQYGPVAELLGGLVVGSSRDLSASYYNPGALALARDPSLLASVESFQATWITSDAGTPFLDFNDFDVRPAPTLFALALPRGLTGSHTWVFSGLTRQDFDLRLDNWVLGTQSGAEALFDQSLTESWFGLSWAHGVGESVGVGLTTYVAYRGHRARREVSGESSAGPSGAVLLVDDFDYGNYRALWKAGVALRTDTWDLGLSLTTPSVRLLGSGSAAYITSAVGGDLGSGTETTVSVRREQDLDSHYASPWTVGAGAAWRHERNTVHATVEWFGAVDAFDVLDASVFAGDPAASRLLGRLRQQAKSVVNFGFGFQRNVSDRFSYYGAFTTDFTYADKQRNGGHSLSTWDLYHVTAGTSLQVREAKFTLGVAYAFGEDPRTLSAIVVPPGSPPELGDVPLDVSFSRLKVLVGFDFGR